MLLARRFPIALFMLLALRCAIPSQVLRRRMILVTTLVGRMMGIVMKVCADLFRGAGCNLRCFGYSLGGLV
jgi:hypothetical protein